jgi:hypothetical protein
VRPVLTPAPADGDHVASSGMLTFNASERTKTAAIEVKGDRR